MNVKSLNNIYNSNILKQGFKFASNNSALFVSGVSLGLSCAIRPLTTMLTPNTKKEDKKISLSKSLSSAVLDFLFMFMVSVPFVKGLGKIEADAQKYLTPETLKKLAPEGELKNSKQYQCISQMFKLGLGFLFAYPKALLSNKIITPMLKKKSDDKKEPSFKGNIEKLIANTINNTKVQNLAQDFSNSKYLTHLMALKDLASTGAFIHMTSKNKNLESHQKNILNLNALLSTGLCMIGGYALDILSDKPMQKFIDNFSRANKNSPDLAKYQEGIKLTKTALVFGVLYYALIPPLTTFLSSKLAQKINSKQTTEK